MLARSSSVQGRALCTTYMARGPVVESIWQAGRWSSRRNSNTFLIRDVDTGGRTRNAAESDHDRLRPEREPARHLEVNLDDTGQAIGNSDKAERAGRRCCLTSNR